MKKLLGVFLFVSLLNTANAQNGELFVDLNYSTFSFSQLRELQDDQLKGVKDYPLAVNDDFSSNIGFTLGYKINNQFAAYFSYNTTGGKISYADYSGVIRLTQPLKQYVLGGMYTFPLLENSENFRFGFKAFASFTSMEINSYSKLLDNSSEDSIELRSTGLGIGPTLIYEQPIWKVRLRFSMAYDLVFNGKLTLKDNDDMHLEDSSGDDIKADWSGIRAGIGISIPI